MEHFVQFGITIDDERIQDLVLRNAERNITAAIKKDFETAIFGDRSCWSSSRNVSPWLENQLKIFLDDHKDEILERASNNLVERMLRMKVVKEKVATIAAEA